MIFFFLQQLEIELLANCARVAKKVCSTDYLFSIFDSTTIFADFTTVPVLDSLRSPYYCVVL